MNPGIAHPLWLLAPLGLLLLVVATPHSFELPGEWSRAVSSSLRNFLSGGVNVVSRRHRLSPMFLLWLILATALSSISFGQMNAPALRNLHARVLVIDLGLGESGLQQVAAARRLLEQTDTVPTAVVAVTRQAFVVVPFTTDFRHIDRYLEVLDTEVMPIDGRATLLGLDRAVSLLRNNDILEGQVILFSDRSPPVQAIETDIAMFAEEHLWLVIDKSAQPAWRRYASQLGARIVDPGDGLKIHRDLEQRRQRASLSSTSIRQRRELTPWLTGASLLLWLLVFFRREES